eukprot:MONOS_10229.1-p1 / transcript=MONOS_10229.1 / gene=MONOS_10229 / organism=Monocercomonoides_exilis_PA203 / gene_product=unspecified product / transcript_product=unspecified product / location=Mono_scaffold00456:10900-12366(-) / protein_length=312 / sequence_SO=supercontig / SO=protein_coding / is_pseudo=false
MEVYDEDKSNDDIQGPSLAETFSIAMNKEESEEAQKEVEIALLALNNTGLIRIEQKLYLKEIKEIIKYHQEHRNLTRLAYQSAWMFLIDRLLVDNSLEDTILNEMHFIREAVRELEELTRRVDWKKKGEEMSKEESNEVLVIRRWIHTIDSFLLWCELWIEKLYGIMGTIVQVFRESKDNQREIHQECIYSLRKASMIVVVEIEELFKGGAVETVMEEMNQSTLDDDIMWDFFHFFLNISRRLIEEDDDDDDDDGEKEEAKRKATKMEIFEKLEEEGYEDVITSFFETLKFLKEKYDEDLSLNISDYSVNV